MIGNETRSWDQPPVLSTVVCIWLSGAVASAAGAFLVFPQSAAVDPNAYRLLQLAVYAFLGGAVLRSLLPHLARLELSYASAAGSLAVGGLVGEAIYRVGVHVVAHAAPAQSPAINPIIWSGSLLSLVGSIAGLAVSYQAVVMLSTRVAAAGQPEPELEAHEDRPPLAEEPRVEAPLAPAGEGWLEVALARTQEAVEDACREIGNAPPGAAAGVAMDALAELATCARILDHPSTRDSDVRKAVAELTRHLETFQNSLADIVADPTANGAMHVYQPGAFNASTADVSSTGGRLRYELERADGLAELRAAFARLESLGVLERR
jgi:hypothetical protein